MVRTKRQPCRRIPSSSSRQSLTARDGGWTVPGPLRGSGMYAYWFQSSRLQCGGSSTSVPLAVSSRYGLSSSIRDES